MSANSEGGCPFSPSSLRRDFDPFHRGQVADPYPTYARARHEAPVFYSDVMKMWYVTRYDDIVAVTRDPVRFSSSDAIDTPLDHTAETVRAIETSWISRGSLTDNDPPSHDVIRRIVIKAFTAREVAGWESDLRAIVTGFIERFERDERAELVEQFSFPVSLRVITEVLGAPSEDWLRLRRWSDDWVAIRNAPLSAEQQAETIARLLECQQYWIDLVAHRRANPRDDLLQQILYASEQEATLIPLLQIVNICMTIIAAGHQTTTDLISLCVYRILRDPEQRLLVQQDPANGVTKAVEETLRADSPVHALMRTTTTSVELGGVVIPKGARVALLYASANHDEAYFPDPGRFDLRRENTKRHLAFGYGIHFCVGAPLARMVARISLELLLARLPNLQLAPDQQFQYSANPIHRGLEALNVEWRVAQAARA